MNAVVLALPAEIEITDAAIAYERTRSGLGREFLKDIRATSRSAARAADSTVEAKAGVRCAATRHFPFRIVYRERRDRIEVLAVLPTRADFDRILARLATR